LEESTPLGRLFDIDVQRSDGSKVSRKIIGLPKRKCLLCHKNAFECSRSRAHSVKDLLRYEAKIMARWFNEAYADNVAMQCTRALLYEVTASPKPGLVDRFDSGANDDMDIFTFQDSALSLTPYFKAFVLCGIRYKSTPLRNVLNYLRPIGIAAERAMYNATKDVNTHKGLIFSAGLLCGALGHLYGNQQDINAQTLSYSISQISRPFKAWFERLAKSPDNTHGETLYLKFGIKGSRGEALEGFPILFNTALPYLKERIKEGFSLNDAGILTLCKIMEVADDTNVITRSSMGKLSIIKRRLKSAAPLEEEKYLSFIKKLNTYLIDLNINPGGSADILALTYFMYFMKI
ncbi:MAG: triphosphoribosyl-dephospho-CoA synthase CitG, partial [Eubacterium sp.]